MGCRVWIEHRVVVGVVGVGVGVPENFEQKRDEITAEQGGGQWGNSM